MNRVDYTSDGEFETVIAAATYAVASLGESSLNKNKTVKELGISGKSETRPQGTIIPTDSRKLFRWLTGRPNHSVEDKSTDDNRNTKLAVDKIPANTKTPSFTDKYLNDTGSKKFGSKKENSPGPKAPSSFQPATSWFSIKKRDGNSVGSSKAGTEADDWEKAQLGKIKNSYEKTMSKILEWETTKKTKAKRQMEQKEREIEQRRAIALQEYRTKISRIEEIASKERALADDRRRYDESKIREKAKRIRYDESKIREKAKRIR